MPFALVVIGLLAVIAAVKGTQGQLGAQLTADFTGTGNFIYWILALFFVGLLGYIPVLEKFSRVGLALVVISLVLSHADFPSQFMSAISAGPTAPQGDVSTSAQQQTGDSVSGSSSGGLFGLLYSLGTMIGSGVSNLFTSGA